MLENANVRHTSEPSIASHTQLHTELLTYSNLTRWLKECEPIRFGEVMEVSHVKFNCPFTGCTNVYICRLMCAVLNECMMTKFEPWLQTLALFW